MSIIIPVKDNPNYKYSLEIENQIYILKFLFNTIYEYWTFSIYDDEETLILSNIKIVSNFPLTGTYKINGLPKGEFMCLSVSEYVTRDTFKDGEADLVYLTEEEIEAV